MSLQNSEKARFVKVLLLASAAAVLAACGSSSSQKDLRDVGLVTSKGEAATVNRYLWAASLETLDFLPIGTADPISGILLTEWYQNPEAPDERFKVNVYVLDTALRADALRVSVFRQAREGQGWRDSGVNPATAREIENAILSRARQLRLNQLDE
jgi:hypothetical protein